MISPNRTIEEFIDQLSGFSKMIYRYHISDMAIVKHEFTTDPWLGAVVDKSWSEKCSGYPYSEADATLLHGKIAEICETIRIIANQNPQDLSIQTHCKQILNQTYLTIKEPSNENCDILKNLANQAPGQANAWGQVKMIAVSIIGIILCIIPGIYYIHKISTQDGEWDQSKRQGLSKAALNMHAGIEATNGPRNYNTGNFFQKRKPVNRAVAPEEKHEIPGSPFVFSIN